MKGAMRSPIHTLIFDLDGTLVDSSESILAGFSAALAAHGIAPRIPLTAEIIGPPLLATLALLAGTRDEALLQQLASAFKAHYDVTGYKATRAYPGVSEMLQEKFSQGVPLHLATNKRLLPTRLILEYLGWNQWFSSVYALDSATPAYPNKAAMLAQLLREQAITSATAAYIGDRAEDGQAADTNGLAFFAANWGYGPFKDQDIPQHWTIVASPPDLARMTGGVASASDTESA